MSCDIRLKGGPLGGSVLEFSGNRAQLQPSIVLHEGLCIYNLDTTPAPPGTMPVYVYDPEMSPGQRLFERADAMAIREVAEQRGVPVQVILDEAKASRLLAGTERQHPADAFLDAAERAGVDPMLFLQTLDPEHSPLLGGTPE